MNRQAPDIMEPLVYLKIPVGKKGYELMRWHGRIPKEGEWIEFHLPKLRYCVERVVSDGIVEESTANGTYAFALTVYIWLGRWADAPSLLKAIKEAEEEYKREVSG